MRAKDYVRVLKDIDKRIEVNVAIQAIPAIQEEFAQILKMDEGIQREKMLEDFLEKATSLLLDRIL